MVGRDPGLDQRRHRRTRAVDEVRSPAAEPGAVRLLLAQEVLDSALDGRVVRHSVFREHLDDVRRDVDTRRIGHLAEVAERKPADEGARVVGVERTPCTVARLHAERPCCSTGGGSGDVGVLLHATQRHHHFSRVVDVRIPVVLELERPATGREIGLAHCPVAVDRDLLRHEPAGRPIERTMVGGQPGIGQRDQRQARVPHR